MDAGVKLKMLQFDRDLFARQRDASNREIERLNDENAKLRDLLKDARETLKLMAKMGCAVERTACLCMVTEAGDTLKAINEHLGEQDVIHP